MGRRGPPPKQYPENVALLRQGITHSSPATPTRKLRPARPRKPGWLTDYGGRVWDTVIAELEPLGLLSPVDRDILAAYCDMTAFAKEARDQLRRDGITRPGRDGGLVKHPAWSVYKAAVDEVNALGTKLALNPSARLRMLHELDDLDLDDDSDLD